MVCSINVRVVSLPSDMFDGSATVFFETHGSSSPAVDDKSDNTVFHQEYSGDTWSSSPDSSVLQDTTSKSASFNVTFYHCTAGSFWSSNETSADDGSSRICELCTEMADGAVEVKCGRR